jgi:helix-turn-helix protein
VHVIAEHIVVTITPDGRLRTRDAAAYLGVSTKTLAAWRRAGVGPRFRKFPQLVFYHQRDLDQWIASQVLAQSTAELRPVPVDGAVREEVRRAVGD